MAWKWAFFTQHYWSWNPAHKAGQTDWRRYWDYKHRRTSQGKENKIMFQTLLYGAAYPKKSITDKRLLRSQPLTFTVPLSTLSTVLSCVKEYGCIGKKKGEKGYGQQQEPEKSRAVTLYKAAAPLTPLPAAGIPICRKQGIPGFRKGRPKSL